MWGSGEESADVTKAIEGAAEKDVAEKANRHWACKTGSKRFESTEHISKISISQVLGLVTHGATCNTRCSSVSEHESLLDNAVEDGDVVYLDSSENEQTQGKKLNPKDVNAFGIVECKGNGGTRRLCPFLDL
ncbi:hypothetical protein GOP47_0002684 [Adiantum capillus-veneris]|uniref:Uncharacterized protein n=1 Tax=Adiantum capillus-veneris TaxID=13818 RepID=A0A9D4VC26_ADICA|nr:hypothetical protein GOP47_0002684 [Adiantum capillus-veneris]